MDRRRDLRAATLFLVDPYRQTVGFWPGLAGSVGLADALRNFEEGGARGPLESEIGGALRSASEIPYWADLRDALVPVWVMFGKEVWRHADHSELLASEEWSRAVRCAQRCVDQLDLWLEEISWPLRYQTQGQRRRIDSAEALRATSEVELRNCHFIDADHRPVGLGMDADKARVRWVGLPLAIAGG